MSTLLSHTLRWAMSHASKWSKVDLNHRPPSYQDGALTAELLDQVHTREPQVWLGPRRPVEHRVQPVFSWCRRELNPQWSQ